MKLKDNLLAWSIYFVVTALCLSPFFPAISEFPKLLGLSLIVSFTLSILNRIAQDITEILSKK